MIYIAITLILVAAELVYFRIADRFGIVDVPNERSSHSTRVLRGGGIVFLFAVWVWSAFSGFSHLWFLLSVTLAAGISLVDDISPLSISVRLVAQFMAMALLFVQLGLFGNIAWWMVVLALVVCVGAANIVNFMDGINGITGGYTMTVLVPLYLLNREMQFVDMSLIITTAIADVIFCFFNLRPKDKARCVAGDVGSIGIAYIMLFMILSLVTATGDVTYMIFLIVYGVDGCMTIGHRMMLHENLGQAHRRHAFQIMANELGMSHIKVSLIYMGLQLAISLCFILLIPSTPTAHWIYLGAVLALLIPAYILLLSVRCIAHSPLCDSLPADVN